jgi:hypothetical protein
VLIPIKDRSSIYEKGILLVVCLTGPFALILAPILLMQLAIYRDWKDRKYVYTITGLGALVQFGAIFFSNRFSDGTFDKDISHWMTAFFNFMSFGSTSAIAKAAALLFYTTTVYAFAVNTDKKLNRHYDSIGVVFLSLLASGAIFYGGGLLAMKAVPHLYSPLGGGARYFFIPYSLIFFASVLVVSKRPVLKCLVYGALVVLAISSFSVFQLSDLQFKAYVKFAKYKNDVVIPIHPEDSWSIHLPDNYVDKLHAKSIDRLISLDLRDARKVNIETQSSDLNILTTLNEDPQLIFDVTGKCKSANYLGVEVNLERPEAGSLQLFWSGNEGFSEDRSLRRNYSGGEVSAQFAMPMQNIRYLRFDPLEKKGSFRIDSVRLYCLGD